MVQQYILPSFPMSQPQRLKRVLFVCEGNRARSQMAEALLRFHGGDRFEAFSAGIRPSTEVLPPAVEVLAESGVPVVGQRGKHFSEFAGDSFDYVITVCDRVEAALREPQDERAFELPVGARIHWSVEDPADGQARGLTIHEVLRENRAELRERIVRFLETEGCVFCQIVAGQAEASFIYRDELVSAFVDIRPVNDGHVLVIPNAHAVMADEVPENVSGRMMAVAGSIARAMPAAGVRMDGYNLWVANGVAAGQEVFHVHLHILPRYTGDGFGLRFPPEYGRRPQRSEMDDLATKIRSAMSANG